MSGVNFSEFIVGLLTVLFIGLKLTGYINWSWWWVFSPLWISVIIALVAGIIVGIWILKLGASNGK